MPQLQNLNKKSIPIHVHCVNYCSQRPDTPNSEPLAQLQSVRFKPVVPDGGMPQAQSLTPINVPLLSKLLKGFPDKETLCKGFTNGFKFHFSGTESQMEARNSQSANLHADAVDAKLASELSKGRVAGPFKDPPLPNFKCSPLAIREKAVPGTYRLLHNLSYPYDESSVNGGIDQCHKTVKYASLQSAIKVINQLGRGCFMAKADIQSAYRIVPIHPSQHHLLGFKWRNHYYYDKYLPMGMAEACSMFERISDGFVYVFKKFGVTNIVKVLDDFLILDTTEIDCNCSLKKFIFICNALSIPLVEAKTSQSATQEIVFLGVKLDSRLMMASLPNDKLNRYSRDAKAVVSSPTIKNRDLLSLIGKLHFATTVIPIGKPFLRRLIDATKGSSLHSAIRVTEGMKLDISMWQSFLEKYNGVSVITPYHECLASSINLYSDASDLGYGGTYGSNWIQGQWNDHWKSLNIAVRELYPILILAEMFGHLWRNQSILIHCDNQAIVAIIKKQSSKNATIMTLLRPLILNLMLNNVKFKISYIRSENNTVADAISRFQVSPTLLAQYGLRDSPVPTPANLCPEVFIPSNE